MHKKKRRKAPQRPDTTPRNAQCTTHLRIRHDHRWLCGRCGATLPAPA